VIRFLGPEKGQYQGIAESTLAVLNQGATFSDLGVTHDEVAQLSESSDRIGRFLHALNQRIIEKEEAVSSLVEEERCSLLIVVIAGNDPIGDVNSLTRGRFASADTERLMASTDANIVVDLKRYPEKVGVLATVLNSKIVCLPSIAALSVARAFGDERLKDRMKLEGLSLVPAKPQDAINRILSSEVAVALKSTTQGVLSRGPKVGSSTKEAFSKLAKIASTNDQALNRALGNALVAAGLVTDFEIEKDFGTGLSRRTDIVCTLGDQIVRVEVMWRNKTGRADIANYTLGKVANYARAIGFME
jgi:hypothetical protein